MNVAWGIHEDSRRPVSLTRQTACPPQHTKQAANLQENYWAGRAALLSVYGISSGLKMLLLSCLVRLRRCRASRLISLVSELMHTEPQKAFGLHIKALVSSDVIAPRVLPHSQRSRPRPPLGGTLGKNEMPSRCGKSAAGF